MHLKANWETQKWLKYFGRSSGSLVIDRNNMLNILINNLKSAEPTEIVMLLLSFSDNFLWDAYIIFVLPGLSSERDLVIQMSVRRALSSVRIFFLSRAFFGKHALPFMIFGMWVGLGLNVRTLNFGCGLLIKYLICIMYSKNCPKHFLGTVCPSLMIFGMWVLLGLKVGMLNFRYGTCWSHLTAGNGKQCSDYQT